MSGVSPFDYSLACTAFPSGLAIDCEETRLCVRQLASLMSPMSIETGSVIGPSRADISPSKRAHVSGDELDELHLTRSAGLVEDALEVSLHRCRGNA